ncbi:Phage tail tape measure protein [uncultured Caudovirales phage]|uniref:Phage tail tape measure protein n=1 Tax=uncultured Caudovirales phage TaxID=2100421 RepID=A0A6J7WN83_9CAUD|nr:Phage tail tape measure protein [uncultured Caudovirales phage]
MARVELNVVALGDFTSLSSQIKNFQVQIAQLQKNLAGVGVSASVAKELNAITAAAKQTILSTGQFTASTVKMTNETEKFGQSLVNGKLKLSEYYNIIKMRSSEAVTQMKALAVEQTKLQNSMIISDPTKPGLLSVFTPTQIDKVAHATKIAANEANLYAIAVNKGSQSLINWGKNTQWAGRQLTVGMSVPLMLFGSQATQVFKDVNEQITRLQKVYGSGLEQPTQQALDSIKKLTLGLATELASTMGIAVKDTTAMAADLAATGLQGVDLMNATREAMRLQKLGEMDQQSALQTTISLQNVYKLNTQQLSGAIDFLNAVENQTSTSLQDLAGAIPKVGPIVQQLGGSFKDTAIMMVAMKEAGVPAAQSANAIKSALASLINPTKAAKDAFGAYNINIASIAKKTNGNPVQMIMMLQNALKGLSPLVQSQLIEKMFGKFQQARIQALITNLGAANSQTKTAFDLMNANSQQLAAVANQEMKTATESASGKYKRAMETFKADLIPVGEKILDLGTKLLNFGNNIAKIFGGLPGPVKTVMGALAIGVALAGPIIMLTGLVGNFVGYLMKGLFNLKQLATGGKTLGQLLTPELIAAQNASQLFGAGIADDVASVELLIKAIADLTVSIAGMNEAMSMSTGAGRLTTNGSWVQPGIPFPPVPGSQKVAPSDNVPALLSEGEAVIPAAQAKKYGPFIRQMIQGTLPGFSQGVESYSPGGTPQYRSSGGSRAINQMVIAKNEQLVAAQEAVKLGTHLAHAAGVIQTTSDAGKAFLANNEGLARLEKIFPGSVQILSKLVGPLSKDINVRMKEGDLATGKGRGSGVSPQELVNGLRSQGPMRYLEGATSGGLTREEIADPSIKKHLMLFDSTLEKKIEALDKQLLWDKDYNDVVRQTIEEFKVMGGSAARVAETLDIASQTPGGYRTSYGSTGARSAIQILQEKYGAEQRGTSIYLDGSNVGQVKNSKSKGTQTPAGLSFNAYAPKAEVAAYIQSLRAETLAALQSFKAEMQKEGVSIAEFFGEGFNMGMVDSIPGLRAVVDKFALTTPEEIMRVLEMASPSRLARRLGEWFGLGWNKGIQDEIPQAALSAEELANASVAPLAKIGVLGRVKELAGTTAGKFGGMAAMMTLPMLSGYLPQSVGGVNVSGAVSTGVNAASMGGMAAMMTPETGLMGLSATGVGAAVAGIVVAISAASVALKKMAEDTRVANNVMKMSFSVGSVATSYFKTQVDNLANFDFSTVLANVKNHADSIGKNKAAVDELTAAYINSKDQIVNDFINKVKESKGKDMDKLMIDRFNTLLASGLTPDKAKQDILATMNAAGKDNLAKTEVLSSLPNYGKNSAAQGFTGALTSAAKVNYSDLSIIEKLFSGEATGAVAQGYADKRVGTEMSNLAKQLPSTIKQVIDGLDKNVKGSINNSTAAYQSMMNVLKESSPTMAKYLDQQHKNGTNTIELFKAVSLLNAGIVKTPEALDKILKKAGALDALFNSTEAQSYTGAPPTGFHYDSNGKLVPDTGNGTPTTFTGTTAQKAAKTALDARIKSENAILKQLRDQLSTQQKQTAEIKRQNDFAQQTFDLNNQMKTAFISGNYLQAAGFKQQISSSSVDFNRGTQEFVMQSKIDTIQARADMFSQALSDLTTAISDSKSTLTKDVISASKSAVLKGSDVSASSVPNNGTITQNFVINGGDVNAVHKTVTAATKAATGKNVGTNFKAKVTK